MFLHELNEHFFGSFNAFTPIHLPIKLSLTVLARWKLWITNLANKLSSRLVSIVSRYYKVDHFIILGEEDLDLTWSFEFRSFIMLGERFGFKIEIDSWFYWWFNSELIVGSCTVSQKVWVIWDYLGSWILIIGIIGDVRRLMTQIWMVKVSKI